jgi:hypothetical protein
VSSKIKLQNTNSAFHKNFQAAPAMSHAAPAVSQFADETIMANSNFQL